MTEFLTLDRLGKILVLIPGVHALACLMYILLFNMSFGFRISQFSSIQDLFNVSLTAILPFYIWSAIGIIAGRSLAKVVVPTIRYDENLAVETSKLRKLSRILKENYHLAIAFWGTILIVLAVTIRAVLFYGLYGFVEIFFVEVVALTTFAIFHAKVLYEKIPDGSQREMVFFLGFGIISIVFSAMQQAQIAKYLPYRELSGDYISCGGKIILARYGENYLAVGPDSSRAIIDKDCEIKFSVISGSDFVEIPVVSTADMVMEVYRRL